MHLHSLISTVVVRCLDTLRGWTGGGGGDKGAGNGSKGGVGRGRGGGGRGERVGKFWGRGLYQNLLYFTDSTLFLCTSQCNNWVSEVSN